MIAALYVLPDGPYSGLADVDPWPESRDARLYAGPWPVVAHPPCARWGAYATGGPRYRGAKVRGDDGGCFAAALSAVRRWGGVLEHPRGSRAWDRFGLPKPEACGGWTALDLHGGATCCVEQGHYGHAARKPTWLYVVSAAPLPDLAWGSSQTPDPPDCPWSDSDVRTFQKPPRGGGASLARPAPGMAGVAQGARPPRLRDAGADVAAPARRHADPVPRRAAVDREARRAS